MPEAGLYQILIAYYPMEGKGGNIECRILINGELPFSGAGTVTFYRNWIVEREVNQTGQPQEVRVEAEEICFHDRIPPLFFTKIEKSLKPPSYP